MFIIVFILFITISCSTSGVRNIGSKNIDFRSCKLSAQDMASQLLALGYTVDVIVDTNILYVVKMYTDEAPTIVTCSKPDNKMVITEGNRY